MGDSMDVEYEHLLDDTDDEEEYSIARFNENSRRMHMLALVGAHAISLYYKNYVLKVPCRTSMMSGWHYVMEKVNSSNWKPCYEMFRMNPDLFLDFCDLLREKYGLAHSKDMRVEEMVAIFLVTLGQGWGNRQLQDRFQRSGQTIHKYFHKVLQASLKLAADMIMPKAIETEHVYIRSNPKYWPHFKGCVGAIDGTHVRASLPATHHPRFIGRKGTATQNIITVCDFDMRFTFALAGWEGSAHDTRIFNETLGDAKFNFPHPTGDQFYLVDAGYPNRKGYLAPYKGKEIRYHLTEFRNSEPPRNAKERFNFLHSSLRSVIERTFGVWKERWHILDNMPYFEFKDQVFVVVASMAIHNYIRDSNKSDEEFEKYDKDPDLVPHDDPNVKGENRNGLPLGDELAMDDIRDAICAQISNIRR